MRKLGLVVVSVAALGLLTGCGEKKLDCSQEEDGEKTRLILKFDSKDKIVSGSMEVVSDLGEDYSAEEIDELIKDAEEEAKDSELDIKVTKGKNNTVSTVINFKANQLEEVFGSSEDLDIGYEKLKKQAEDEGATCK